MQKYELHEIFPHFQCFVFCGFHDFAFSRPLVIDAAKMQYAVYDYAVEFRLIRRIELFGVGAYRVQADEQIARQFLAFAVVERNDVRLIIMLQVLAVHL